MSRPDRLAGRVLDAAAVLSAVLGVVIAAWWVVCATLGLALVTFETGSMTPTYDTGAIALSAPVHLADVRPGDVVTVDRGAGELPITHRVVWIRRTATGAVLQLKGDANRDPDPRTYTVTSVRLVVGAVPPILLPLTWLARPAGSLTAVVLATIAVGRAFWPRSTRRGAHGRRAARPRVMAGERRPL